MPFVKAVRKAITKVTRLPGGMVTAVLMSPEDDGTWDPLQDKNDRFWPDGLRAVTVSYDHGYGPIAGDITDGVLGQAVLLLEQVERYKSIQVGDERFTFADPGVTGAWSEVVERYRLNQGDRS
ncbi:hypothetical protein [Sciscionella marina]|uniref:hypothetical protein n=1 Tax=Sciscionella marina TaxID=508770 RepID=UPI000381FE12|nr:hypothetical protein [Sciscionella marina]